MGHKIRKGFHFIGNLKLKTGEIVAAEVKFDDALNMDAHIHLPKIAIGNLKRKNIKYGSDKVTEEKLRYENVSLVLTRSMNESAAGPVLTVSDTGVQKITGFLHTVGLESKFEMSLKYKKGKKVFFSTEIEGLIFNSLPGTIKLTGQGVGIPIQEIGEVSDFLEYL